MNKLVKILKNEDGQKQQRPKWHLVVTWGGSSMAACTGEVFGYGEGRAVYETKNEERGGITCPHCIAIVRWYKAVEL